MMQTINIHDYIRPLIAYRNDGKDYYPDGRFLGTCFFIDNKGTAITCAHIIEDLKENEELFSYDIEKKENIKVNIIYTHDTDDFALCSMPVNNNKFLVLKYKQVVLGRDVMSYGFLNGGIIDQTIKVDYRVMKGHISRINGECKPSFRSKQLLETSYPSLSGFSGAPVFDEKTLEVYGMLFGNIESSIEVFSFTDVSANEPYKESVHRIIELGVAHTSDTLVGYLEEYKSQEKSTLGYIIS